MQDPGAGSPPDEELELEGAEEVAYDGSLAMVVWTGETAAAAAAAAADVADVAAKRKVGHRLAWEPCGSDLLVSTMTPVACGSAVRGDVAGNHP